MHCVIKMKHLFWKMKHLYMRRIIQCQSISFSSLSDLPENKETTFIHPPFLDLEKYKRAMNFATKFLFSFRQGSHSISELTDARLISKIILIPKNEHLYSLHKKDILRKNQSWKCPYQLSEEARRETFFLWSKMAFLNSASTFLKSATLWQHDFCKLCSYQ